MIWKIGSREWGCTSTSLSDQGMGEIGGRGDAGTRGRGEEPIPRGLSEVVRGASPTGEAQSPVPIPQSPNIA
jgi:hypothetical protein